MRLQAKLRMPVGDTNEVEYNIFIWRPPEELFCGRQKSYLAAAGRDKLPSGRQKSYLAVARSIIWRPPEEKSYLAAARRVISL